MTDSTADRYLSVSEVGAICGVGDLCVRRWITKGRRGRRLPGYHIGGAVRVLRSDLLAWIQPFDADTPPPRLPEVTPAPAPSR